MSAVQVHVIDDDDAVRDALAFLLSTEDLATATYDSAPPFLAVVEGVSGCVITDVRMPGMDGLELTRRLKTMGVDLPVIIITGHADVALAVAAMKAGAADFIEKPFDDDTILKAVWRALSIRSATDARAAEQRVAAQRIEGLSQRERQVMDGLVAGKANKVIAYDLDISPRTVELYRAHLMIKTGAHSLSELVRLALSAGAA